MNQGKVCTACTTLKPLSEYYVRSTGKVDTICKQCVCSRSREYYRQHKDARNKKHKEYYLRTIDIRKEENKKYRIKHKDRLREWNKHYTNNRLKTDAVYATKVRLRNLIRNTLMRKNYTKKSTTTKILGADYSTVFEHLKQTAINRYGYFTGNLQDYHIDHIYPCALCATQEDLLKYNHFTNLQLLTPADNIAKSDRIDFI